MSAACRSVEQVGVRRDCLTLHPKALQLVRHKDKQFQIVGEAQHLRDKVGLAMPFAKCFYPLYDVRVRAGRLTERRAAAKHCHRREHQEG